MLRKIKWQVPGEPLAARYNWYQGPAVKKHWSRPRSVMVEVNGLLVGVFKYLCFSNLCLFRKLFNMQIMGSLACTRIYRVSQEERSKLREGVPYVKLYRYNPKHLCRKLNGYGDKGQRKVWSFCGSTYCTWFAWRNTHTLRIDCPCLQLVQARSSLRLHM